MSSERAASQSTLRRTLRNVFSNWGAFVVTALINFFLSPLIVRTLGDALYGAWTLLGSLVGYMGLLDLGVRGAVTRFVAVHHAAGRHEEAGRFVSAAFFLFSAAGLLAMLLSCVVAIWGLDWFDVPAELINPSRIAVILLGANIAVSIMGGLFGGIVVSMQRFDAMNVINVSTALGRAAAVALAMWDGRGIVALAVIQLVAATVHTLAAVVLSRRLYPELPFRVRSWGRRHVREIFAFGAVASLLHGFATIINYSDAVLIGGFLPVAMITFFAIAANLTQQIRQVISGVSYITAPMAGALQGSDRVADVGSVLLQGARFATLAILPILVTFVLRGESFINLWMGPEYGELSGRVLLLLSIALWPFAGLQVLTSTLMGLNRHRALLPAFVFEALCNVALSVALVGSLGVVGVAIGTLVPRVLVSAGYGPLCARQLLGVSLGSYWSTVILRPALAMLPFAIASWLFEMHWKPEGLVLYFAQVLLALPLAAGGAWLGALSASERSSYLSSLRGVLNSNRDI